MKHIHPEMRNALRPVLTTSKKHDHLIAGVPQDRALS